MRPAALMVMAFALDVGTFWLGTQWRGGTWADGNPAAQAVWSSGGILGLVLMKVVCAALVVTVVRWRVRTRSPRLAFLVAGWIGVVGAVSNLPALR